MLKRFVQIFRRRLRRLSDTQNNSELVHAFPTALRKDAAIAIKALPENPYPWRTFTVLVGGETVAIPRRIYHPTQLINTSHLNELQKELINCLLTRHHDGFVRQRYLSQIINSNNVWIPPFVVQLLGEYVVEILDLLYNNLGNLNDTLYREFLEANPEFLAVTAQRVASYWDCYYRSRWKKNEYVGFRMLQFFHSLTKIRSAGRVGT